MRSWLQHAVVLVGLTLGCAADDPVKLVSDIDPGLVMLGSAAFTDGDHLTEMVVHEGHVYAANSWSGIGALRLEDDGGLTVTDHGDEGFGATRCTTLALHAASDTLYCSGDSPPATDPDQPRIERFDLSEPGRPVKLDPFLIVHWSVRDVAVAGDTLLIHQFDDGLWTAKIGADGQLSELQRAPLKGNARVSVAVGERVVTAFAGPAGQGAQLRLLDPNTWEELARLSLDGPPLGLSADADGQPRVVVGLGSGGMALVEVGPASLTLTRTLTPPAVVTHGIVSQGLAFAITLSGVFAYSLDGVEDGDEPHMFAFGAEGTKGDKREGNMLHGLLHDGELLTSDWTWIERWRVDPDGEIVALDIPRGVHVGPEGSIHWQLRNPGPVPLRAEFWYRREHLFEVDVNASGLTKVELSPELRAKFEADEPTSHLAIRIHDPSVAREGQPLSTSSFTIVQREADDPVPPAIGDPFPTVTLADEDMELFTLPLAEPTQTIWLTYDCALMWPQLEDLAWLEQSGRDLGRGTPIVITDVDLYLNRFANHWAIENLPTGLWGPTAPPEVAAANAAYGDELLRTFVVEELPAGSSTSDYVIDEDNQIKSLERMYRGPWTLALPWPWD
ncbi:hypothetical protein ENSA5_56390 [Enhygromyxa salina]|uniref:Uncharacterized protein n=1 Tax=Enhygromyxa salina TaxID=215803 RepID=A0A2S9XEW0_9BACT|nr:hypothetical protein [Enhygromyxa salina]PRP91290.1 hypothetical protein ENSA5_56390 [Enhygromyxa salina]